MKRARALAMLIAPLLAACGALIGAEWDGTLRPTEIEGSTGDEEGDSDAHVAPPDAAMDARDEADAAPIPKTCGGDSEWCICEANMPKEDGGVLCSLASIAGADDFCCASKNWPISGTCLCSAFKCGRSSPDFCSCGLADRGLTGCAGSLCCYRPGYGGCDCYDTGGVACPLTGDVRVRSCTLADIACGTDEKRVDDCGIVKGQ